MGIADHLHVIRQVFSLLRKLQLSVRFFIRLMYLLFIYGDALVCEVILRERAENCCAFEGEMKSIESETSDLFECFSTRIARHTTNKQGIQISWLNGG